MVKASADAIVTNLETNDMDKMIQDSKGNATITDDGVIILKQM